MRLAGCSHSNLSHQLASLSMRLPLSCRAQFSTSRANRSLLQHRHVAPAASETFVRYSAAEALQEQHRSTFLKWKALPDTERLEATCPRPQLITFESTPTFTLGRRQDALTDAQASRLTQKLDVDLRSRSSPINESGYTPEVKKTSRGGLTTYHGPGQLVMWPVIDMHSPLYDRFGVSSYAAHLENATRRLLADQFGIETYTNPDEPGVWVRSDAARAEHKIAALGVHHRRYVTALGIALNIDVPVTGSEDVNPWARFVPCGLEGKLVTSVASELERRGEGRQWDLSAIATQWAQMFEAGLLDPGKRVFH